MQEKTVQEFPVEFRVSKIRVIIVYLLTSFMVGSIFVGFKIGLFEFSFDSGWQENWGQIIMFTLTGLFYLHTTDVLFRELFRNCKLVITDKGFQYGTENAPVYEWQQIQRISTMSFGRWPIYFNGIEVTLKKPEVVQVRHPFSFFNFFGKSLKPKTTFYLFGTFFLSEPFRKIYKSMKSGFNLSKSTDR